jgi:hypothetical protein
LNSLSYLNPRRPPPLRGRELLREREELRLGLQLLRLELLRLLPRLLLRLLLQLLER